MTDTAVLERPQVCLVTNGDDNKVAIVVKEGMTVRDALDQGGIDSPVDGRGIVADGAGLVELDDDLGMTQALEIVELFANG